MFSARRKTARPNSLRLQGKKVEVSMQTQIQHKLRSGRPKVDERVVKRHNLTVRLSDQDLILLDHKAKQAGLSFSAFLREAGLSRKMPKPVPEVTLKTFLELGRIGNNLNQMLKLIHEGHFDVEVAEIIVELFDLVYLVRKEVRNDRQTEDG
jgi:predicted DNA binding CopG/RHH family protein